MNKKIDENFKKELNYSSECIVRKQTEEEYSQIRKEIQRVLVLKKKGQPLNDNEILDNKKYYKPYSNQGVIREPMSPAQYESIIQSLSRKLDNLLKSDANINGVPGTGSKMQVEQNIEKYKKEIEINFELYQTAGGTLLSIEEINKPERIRL